MKNNLVNELIKVNKNLIIPSFLYKNINKLNLTLEEFILLVYFINLKDNITFDMNKIKEDVNLESSEILELINNLNEKNYISIETKKNNGVIEEFISLDLFYNKMSSMLLDGEKEEKNSDIYSLFEKEFGRTLSPSEYEQISNWLQNDISEEMIKEALKEASLSGVHTIRYIDSIIFNWSKKGYKNTTDIKRKTSNDEKIETIYEYDWLNE